MDQAEKPYSDGQDRLVISKWEREELEDKFLRMREQNIELKRYARRQEDKIKRMATKLLRLAADKKKMEGGEAVGKREYENEERIDEMQEKIRELEKQNHHLKNKLTILKQQPSSTTARKPSPYGHVKARVNSGMHGRTKSQQQQQQQRISQNIRVQGETAKTTKHIPPPLLPQPRYGHSLLEEARIEKEELEHVISSLHGNIRALEADRQDLTEELRQNKREHELVIAEYREQLNGVQRKHVGENVDIIKLRREVDEKANKLKALEAKYISLNDHLEKMKESHTQVLNSMDALNNKLKEEQAKCVMYQNELKSSGVTSKTLVEQQQLIDDLKAEREILKQANENLVKSAFDADRERQHQALERQLKVEIATLEATVKSELEEKNEILDQLMKERESNGELHQEIRDIKVSHFSLKEQHDLLTEKMKFFTKESAVDVQELEEALTLLKRRKEAGSQELDFLEKVDDAVDKDAQKRFHELQLSHADTINELEKTRNMLVLQHKINKDYQNEVERVTAKMIEDKKEFDFRLQEYAQLLDIRAERIKKLESQMKDVAYGTKQYNLTNAPEDSEFDEVQSSVHLERGENLFEIHIGKVCLKAETLLDETEPSCFITYEFYEHEIQATSVMKGKRMDFNFTSFYVVKVDDFFLHYMQKESTLVELHRALGSSYETIAACKLKFRELLERSHGRYHGTATLFGTHSSNDGQEVATMEFWARLRVPMEQAIRLFKERSKALGYLNAQDYKALKKTGDELPSDVNELFITVYRCNDVMSRRQDIQPSPYVVYKFYDFADHDTDIIGNSNNPQWNDRKTCPVPMTEELDTYLRSQTLDIYVLDDVDPEPATYLGLAKIPLISLAHGKAIKGTFELRKESGEQNGTVDVLLEWRNTYLPASAKIKTQPQYLPINKEEIDREKAIVVSETVKEEQPPVPLVASTPKQPRGNVVKKPPKARPRSATKKPPSRPSSATTSQKQSAQEVVKETGILKDDIDVSKDMSIDELIKASEQVPSENQKYDDDDEVRPRDVVPQAEHVETDDNASQDTMFADEETESQLEENEGEAFLINDDGGNPEINEMIASGSEGQSSDSDGLVVSSTQHHGALKRQINPQVTIMVSSLMLYPDTSLTNNPAITQLFVAYKFLNCDPAELETPVALPKPAPHRPIHYNFKKVFPVDGENNEEKQMWLIHTISPDNPDQGRLVFTVVSEPANEGDCEDVAFAVVDLLQIVKDDLDVVDQDIELYSLQAENELVGCLTVSVLALDALKSLYLTSR